MADPTFEIAQATGAQTQIIYCKESDWGVSPNTGYRKLNVVAGESLDDNITTFESQVIRSDRMRNPTVRGSHKPGGALPIEIGPAGISMLLWHLLGGTVTTTAGDGSNGAPVGKFIHVIKGSKVLPTGFTIEKGFMDLAVPKFFAMKGCRVSKFTLNGNVDQIVTGSVDILAREMAISAASVAGVSAVTDAPVVSPYTSIQAGIYKNDVQISVCQTLTLNVDNGMKDENNIVLGSAYRQNLKPGTRKTDGNATFLFQDTTFYEAAVDGTKLKLAIKLADALDNSIELLMPKVQLLPNNSSPKIASDGPLTIPANFEATPDAVLGTDIQVTIVSDEATIDY